jgi:hypothetical protein
MNPLRVLDLFGNLGNFTLGLERTGAFKTVAFCEPNRSLREALARRWPGVPVFESLEAITRERLAADELKVDVVCGGFPPHDFIGKTVRKKRGEEAWREQVRILLQARPRWVILEISPAFSGLNLKRIMGLFRTIGFVSWWGQLPPDEDDVNGRLWIVSGNLRRGAPPSFGRETCDWEIRSAIAERHDWGLDPKALEAAREISGPVSRVQMFSSSFHVTIAQAIGETIRKFETAAAQPTT